MSNNIDQPTLIYCPSLSCETMGAFIVAIARQVRPLPTDLQAKIHDLGQQVQANAQLLEQPIKLVRPLLTTYPTLQFAYSQARVELERNYSDRSSGELIKFIKGSTTAEIANSFKVVCTAADSFKAAKNELRPSPKNPTTMAKIIKHLPNLLLFSMTWITNWGFHSLPVPDSFKHQITILCGLISLLIFFKVRVERTDSVD
jgi:hypothetical protein